MDQLEAMKTTIKDELQAMKEKHKRKKVSYHGF